MRISRKQDHSTFRVIYQESERFGGIMYGVECLNPEIADFDNAPGFHHKR
ncbi:hypothetical protein IMSAGC014_01527 [Bacteroidaceae bacterium]|nr:hypothetical protein IMSAGC014_01527 [Bacteroidaceae bacterium]